MHDAETILTWRGHELVDRDGEKIGKIVEIYTDQHTGEPGWASVKTGLLGRREALVPITGATSEGEIVRVPFYREHVEATPDVDPEEGLSGSAEQELLQHYGMDAA